MNKNIQVACPFFDGSEIKSLRKTLESNWVAPGPKTLLFEKKIKKKFKVKNAIAINSCTSGIAISLIALGAKKGDEIITPSNTFISSINTFYNLGLKIKLCDVDKDTWSVTDKIFKKNISKKTKFFVPVHFAGNPLEIEKIIKTATRNNIKIIEDAATAFGSKVSKKYVGSFNNSVTIFSLHANKIINSADGGIITTNNNSLAKKIRILINNGLDKNSWNRRINNNFKALNATVPGYKYNYNDILASIAISQFNKIDKIISFRKRLYKRYVFNLRNLIKEKLIRLQILNTKNLSSMYCFQILLVGNDYNLRNKLALFLEKNNITTTVYYTPAHLHDFYKKKLNSDNLENTNELFYKSLALPFHNKLKNKDVDKVCRVVINYLKKNAK